MKGHFVWLSAGIMVLAADPAFSQSNSADVVSEPCRATQHKKLDDLEKERVALEEALTAVRVRAQAQPLTESVRSGEASTPRPALEAELKDKEGALIELLYQLECLRSDMQPDPVMRGSKTYYEITTFYATNREPTGQASSGSFYGAGDTRKLAYGRTLVSIPSAHTIGELELPSLWKLEINPDPNRHFLLKSVTPLTSSGAKLEIAATLQTAKSKSLLLFVHGYNVSFSDAALRTAQLAHDLRFPGVAMFYSWPSAGRARGYLHDEESSRLAENIFDELLDDLTALEFKDIYLVAHSMGNRVVGQTLAHRVKEQKSVAKLREVLLAAPDINVEIFKRDIAPRLTAMSSTRKTIYASSKDVALKASRVAHGFPRIGETSNGVFIHAGFDTVDASASAPLVRAFGHSYVLDSVPVLNDIEDMMVWGRSMAQRSLRRLGIPPNAYWRFP